MKKIYKENKDRKVAIIQKAEELGKAVHENFEGPMKEILQLQQDWKNAGHIEQWEENKLWKRFREACDVFFNAKREKFNARDQEQIKNLELKEELVKRVENFKPTGAQEEDFKTLRAFSDEWKTILHVTIKEKQQIWEKFKNALDKCYDNLILE